MERIKTVHFVPHPENVFDFSQEFRGMRIGDEITWADATTRLQFTKPAFGYGNGPFKLLKIVIAHSASAELLRSSQPVTNAVLFEIETPKGKRSLSADYFKKQD